MRIFDFLDYKAFALARIQAMPQRGRGEFMKIARRLKTHTTRISHIFRGSTHLTLEQACELTLYLGLKDLEAEYFLLLVQRDRAGTANLKKIIGKQIENVRARSHELVHRVDRDRVLTEEEKSTFYSNWYYSGIRLATSIPLLRNIDTLSGYFQLPRERVRKVLDFLVSTGLCAEKDGEVLMQAKLTHLESQSPLAARHHANWRIKAMQKHERISEGELAYTAPMSISKKDQVKIREMSAHFIEQVLQVVKKSEPEETLMCLNMDWFEF
jgi:uncharacterized protein (TIGR02147 family)